MAHKEIPSEPRRVTITSNRRTTAWRKAWLAAGQPAMGACVTERTAADGGADDDDDDKVEMMCHKDPTS